MPSLGFEPRLWRPKRHVISVSPRGLDIILTDIINKSS